MRSSSRLRRHESTLQRATRTLRIGTGAFAFAAAIATGPLLAAPAMAEEPLELDGVVTDTTNTLGGRDYETVQSASADLNNKTGVTLYLVVVDTFENPNDGFEWANATVAKSQLGPKDVVLYIGKDVQNYGLSADKSLDLSSEDLRNIENGAMSDISSGRYAEAAEQVATDLDRALRAEELRAEEAGTMTTILGVGAAGTAAVGGTMYYAGKRRKKKKHEAEVARRAEAFAKRSETAGVELVRMDNLIRSADEELQFAQAQFGAQATAEYAKAVSTAKSSAQEAFALQAKLFDHIPDTEEEQDAWLDKIESLTQSTGKALSEQQDRFAKLRARQEQVPQLVAALEAAEPAATTRLAGIVEWVATLPGKLEDAAIAPIRADAEQAGRLLALARVETDNAKNGWAANDHGAAVIDVADAEGALAQADSLMDALEAAEQRILDAPAVISSQAKDAEQLLLQIKQLHRAAPAVIDVNEQEIVARARTQLDEIAALNGSFRDPLHTTSVVTTLRDNLQNIFTESLGEKEQIEQAQRVLTETMSDARAEIAVAERKINTHRGELSAAPRARLAQAIDQLSRAEALTTEDPVQALQHAKDAKRQALTAAKDADDEMSRYSQNPTWVAANFGTGNQRYWPDYGNHRRGYRSGGGDDLAGAIIGGIIGGLLSGGGSSHRSSSGGSGGGGFGGSSSGGGGWSSGGGFR
ncbi:TPM domain-containing protein [Gulosibacter bifidus]|uniref:TPM domain-containing protein n=1 Tax=Gulosibacter bifidus TaxID=272239 RepID=A0ABW5RHH9_9MICO|nr:TPM domain-containing protein [Gulosibacter bifidus]